MNLSYHKFESQIQFCDIKKGFFGIINLIFWYYKRIQIFLKTASNKQEQVLSEALIALASAIT